MLLLCIILFLGYSFESQISLHLTDPIHGTMGDICADGNSSVISSDEKQMSLLLIDLRDSTDLKGEFENVSILFENRLSQSKIVHSNPHLLIKSFAIVVPYTSVSNYEYMLKDNIINILGVTESDNSPHDSSKDYRVLTCSNSTLAAMLRLSGRNSATGLIAKKYLPRPTSLGEEIVGFLILYSMSIGSIVLAAAIIMRNQQIFLVKRRTISHEAAAHPFISKIVLLTMVCISLTMIVLVFFLYDSVVYFFLVMFVVAGANSMSFVFTILLKDIFPRLKQSKVSVLRKKLDVIRIILFFVSLAFTLTWFFYRNDLKVGWNMQNTIAIFLIVAILSELSYCVSFKIIILFFAIFLIYDVFFVFITPFFFKASSISTPETAIVADANFVRVRRSAESIMEAVATGSAGKSGELIPLVFKIFPSHIFPETFNVCNKRQYMLLGFGDSVLPGILCSFLAFYDSCWNRKIPYSFLASIFGYCVGGLISSVVLLMTKSGQPALLYLCPCTIGATLLTVLVIGGKLEIRNLWLSNFPSPPDLLLPASKRIEEESGYRSVENSATRNNGNSAESQQNI